MPLWLISVGVKTLGFLKGISWKVWVALILVIALLFAGWRIQSAVQNHFEYVHRIEGEKKDLEGLRDRLNTRITELSDINTRNQAIYDESLRQAEQARRIADEERQKAETRAERYRSIRDAANATPEADRQPVSPVVRDTVDRLWPQQ